MYADGLSQNKDARRLRDRQAQVCANQRRRSNEINITPKTTTKSLAEILCSIWHRQEAGYCVIRAYKRGNQLRFDQLWARSDEITPKKLRRWLDRHQGWNLEFCPVTFERNLRHLDWVLFERGRWNSQLGDFDHINRRECLSYLEYGPLKRSDEFGREHDIVVEDKGLWFIDYPSYIDYERRDGLFISLPTRRLTFDELMSLYRPPVRKFMGPPINIDRSGLMWLIGKECVLKGMRDPDEIKTVIRKSFSFQSRLEERGTYSAERTLDADVRKLLREAR